MRNLAILFVACYLVWFLLFTTNVSTDWLHNFLKTVMFSGFNLVLFICFGIRFDMVTTQMEGREVAVVNIIPD